MSRLPRSVLTGLAALTVLRLVIAATLPLGDDETFYWGWSRHLAAGYVDHPPAIAVLVWVATHLLGSTAFAIHSAAAVLSFATSLALWVLAREVLGRDNAAAWSVILFNIIPVFSGGALLAAPDAPLGLCWVLTLLWSWRAVRREDGSAWLAAGIWLGFALDSKYTAAALPFSVGLWLALSPAHRRWLRRPGPYLGLALALALFAPVVWWNEAHRWASFAFTLVDRPAWSEGGNLSVFLLFQLLYLAPLMWAALLWALGIAVRRGLGGDDRWLFLAAAGLPLIAGMFAASLAGHVKGHWPAPGYITAAIALAGLTTERPWGTRSGMWRGAAVAVVGSTVVITTLILALPAFAPIGLPPRLDPTIDYSGWRDAVRTIGRIAQRDARGSFFVMSDRYQVAAQFDFATGGQYHVTTITGRDQYGVWTRWADLRGRDGLFIGDGRYPLEVNLNEACREIEVEPVVPVVRRGVVVRTLNLVWCRKFVGHPVRRAEPRVGPGFGGPAWRLSRGASPSAATAAPDRRG